MSKEISTQLMGALCAICIGLSSFALKWSCDANAEMKVLNVQLETISKQLETMNNNTESDERQDEMIRKFWKLHNWSKDEINNLRHDAGKPPASFPDLD